MVAFAYLEKGLSAMARAHRANAMAGHLGAAVVAGYFVGEELFGLEAATHRAVEGELDRIIAGEEPIWYDPKRAGIPISELFAALPRSERREDGVRVIAGALAKNIGETRQSGHNVIFASLAIRALHGHPALASAPIVEGIQKLEALFDAEGPGRGYYGKERGWLEGENVPLPEATDFPAYDSERAMADAVIDRLIRDGAKRRQGFGGLFHVINHAAALVELSHFGFPDLARQGWPAHHRHARLWDTLPDLREELGELKPAEIDPRTPEYWHLKESSQWSAWLTHRIKTLYGFSILSRFIDDPSRRQQAEAGFRYLMG